MLVPGGFFKAAASFGLAGFEAVISATAAAGAWMRTGFLHAGQATRLPMSEGLLILRTASQAGQTIEIDDAIVRRLLEGIFKSFQTRIPEMFPSSTPFFAKFISP
jgi:hypothetical protein